ncbi:MAG TPA: PqqD family protein [Longimicrobiales bacterium]|nr:PqqD family protein [Longimicrobiales bacterium]
MAFRRVGEDWVLFDPVAQRVEVLDATAALVWSHCSGEMDVGALRAEVRRAFGAAFREGSVTEALETFRVAGLLRAE